MKATEIKEELENEIRELSFRMEDVNHVHSKMSFADHSSPEEETVSMKSRPSSTPRLPTLSGRATLVRSPNKPVESQSVAAEEENVPSTKDFSPSTEDRVLITELFDKDDCVDDLDMDKPCLTDEGEISQEDIESQENENTSLYQPEFIETVRESRMDDYWDTDLEDEELTEEIVPEEPMVTHYKKVCNDLGVVPVSYFLRHIKDLEITMRFHGLGPTATKAIALILKDDVHLERLNLQGNWMEEEGAQAISRLLEENDYITEMVLADNKFKNEGGKRICKMLEINAGLRILDLAGNDFDDSSAIHFANAIENSKYLKKLDLSRNRFSEAAGELLGPAIGANDRLDSIDLSWNHLRKGGACAVARGLKENVGLKVCKLAWNGFGPEGGIAIAEALVANQSLIELDITGNRLNAHSAERIARAFRTNDTLRTLRMGNNLITTGGAIALATAINDNEGCDIELLDLTDVPVEYEFLRIVEDIKLKKPEFHVIHGPVIRSGNTKKDLKKRAIDPYKKKEPVVILKDHIVVNDMRLIDILARYDPSGSFSISPEDFISALDELAVPYDKMKLQTALEKIATDQSGRIYLGDALQSKDMEELKRVTFTDGQT